MEINENLPFFTVSPSSFCPEKMLMNDSEERKNNNITICSYKYTLLSTFKNNSSGTLVRYLRFESSCCWKET